VASAEFICRVTKEFAFLNPFLFTDIYNFKQSALGYSKLLIIDVNEGEQMHE
jgi:hypothetical protein